MRGLASILLTGILVLLATNLIALPVSFGLRGGAQPKTERGATIQFVDRTHKGDRLNLAPAVDEQQLPQRPPVVLVGCDSPVSSLSASARAVFPDRCIAETAHAVAG
jgi:hypothetical protein